MGRHQFHGLVVVMFSQYPLVFAHVSIRATVHELSHYKLHDIFPGDILNVRVHAQRTCAFVHNARINAFAQFCILSQTLFRTKYEPPEYAYAICSMDSLQTL
jgi:hypothetical protein